MGVVGYYRVSFLLTLELFLQILKCVNVTSKMDRNVRADDWVGMHFGAASRMCGRNWGSGVITHTLPSFITYLPFMGNGGCTLKEKSVG